MSYAHLYFTILGVLIIALGYSIGVDIAFELFRKRTIAIGSWFSVIIYYVRMKRTKV